MLSHPLSRRSTVSIYVYLHTFFLFFSFLSFFFEQLASFLLSRSESGIVLVEDLVVDDTFHVRCLLYISPIKFEKGMLLSVFKGFLF